MKKRGWIIVLSWGNFHIFEIIDDTVLLPTDLDIKNLESWEDININISEDFLHYNDGDNIDLGFFRKIKPIAKDISRSKYADSTLNARLKARQTNVNISDLSESIKNALLSYKHKKLSIFNH